MFVYVLFDLACESARRLLRTVHAGEVQLLSRVMQECPDQKGEVQSGWKHVSLTCKVSSKGSFGRLPGSRQTLTLIREQT